MGQSIITNKSDNVINMIWHIIIIIEFCESAAYDHM